MAGAGGGRPGFGTSTASVPVRVASATVGDFPVYYKALGTVTATNTVNVRSRVAGELVKVHFKEGQQVKAGDLLAEIDPRSYQIALQQAEGTLAQNQAQLKNAQIDLARYKGLYAEDSIAKQTLDTQAALVAQYEGTKWAMSLWSSSSSSWRDKGQSLGSLNRVRRCRATRTTANPAAPARGRGGRAPYSCLTPLGAHQSVARPEQQSWSLGKTRVAGRPRGVGRRLGGKGAPRGGQCASQADGARG